LLNVECTLLFIIVIIIIIITGMTALCEPWPSLELFAIHSYIQWLNFPFSYQHVGLFMVLSYKYLFPSLQIPDIIA
jgi:hypothetical protein